MVSPKVASATEGAAPKRPAKLAGLKTLPKAANADTAQPPMKNRKMMASTSMDMMRCLAKSFGNHSARIRTAAALSLLLLSSARAAEPEFTPFESIQNLLDAFAGRLPGELASSNQAKWNTWNRSNDREARSRLEDGDLDSMVNLLLYGTSFTSQPRIGIQELAEMTRRGVLKARVADLVQGFASPGNNERLLILGDLLRRRGFSLDTLQARDKVGVFILQNLQRVLEEKRNFAARAAEAAKAVPATSLTLAERSQLFRDRGVSLDTTLLPDFSIDLALQRLKDRGLLNPGEVERVAVVGPGLEFIDKDENSAFDYFPMQTVQPFAVLDSLTRLGLTHSGVTLTAMDISPRVIEHFRQAHEAARKGKGYTIQLPQDVGYNWPAAFESYWRNFGGAIGRDVKPIPPPTVFGALKARAVEVRPDVVVECEAVDLNIVAQRIKLPEAERFDLVIATNIFVYYDAFQQAVGLQNIASMMKSGGLLLANDQLPVLSGSGMQLIGVTEISDGGAGRDAVAWYQKR